jgi:diaminohydroxyphosphoribosylaminopyrimidine deaminase/5-amino-6-(5-phosphoribosylamino)uracil reductase
VIELKPKSSQSTQFYFKHLLGALSKKGFNEILVEGGPSLVSSLVTENLVDEFLIYKSSKILGAGVSFVQLNSGKDALTNERQWVFKSVNRVGEDVFMSLRKKNNSFYGLANV